MASKLILDFFTDGVVGQTITIRPGETFTFVSLRTGFHKVTIDDDYILTGRNFKNAYVIDENSTNQSIVTFVAVMHTTDVGRVTIENPDNNFFVGFQNPTTFINSRIEYTTQIAQPTLTATLSEATTNKCGSFKLNLNTNQTNGEIRIFNSSGQIGRFLASETPVSVEFVRPSTSSNLVVKLYEPFSLNILQVIKEVTLIAPAVLSITSITIAGSILGGADATINATYSVGTQYSLDGIDYQGGKQFTGLTQGSYTAYAKDNFGCIVTKAFTVLIEQTEGLTVTPYFNIPIHNSIRFAKRSGNTFLNYLSAETPGRVGIFGFVQDYLQTDIIRTQFKSSYKVNKVFLINCDLVEIEIPVIKLSENINRTNIFEGSYKNYKNRLAVYFTSGNIYNTDGTPKDEGHILNGLLPVWYKEGMDIFIEGVGATQIDSIEFDEGEEIVFAVTQLDPKGQATNKKITSIHTEHPYEVYEFDVNFNLPESLYQLRLEYGTEFCLSEIIKIHSELPEDFLTVIWYNNKNNDILYNTGIQQLRRLQWEKYFTLIPKSEKETYDTDTSVELVNSKSFSVYELAFMPMPMEVARGLMYGFDNSSSIVINGAVFVCENGVKIDPIGPLYSFTAELTLTNQTMRGQQILSNVIDASFLTVEQDASGTGYLLL